MLLRDTGGAEIMLSEDDLSMLLHYLLSMDALWFSGPQFECCAWPLGQT